MPHFRQVRQTRSLSSRRASSLEDAKGTACGAVGAGSGGARVHPHRRVSSPCTKSKPHQRACQVLAQPITSTVAPEHATSASELTRASADTDRKSIRMSTSMTQGFGIPSLHTGSAWMLRAGQSPEICSFDPFWPVGGARRSPAPQRWQNCGRHCSPTDAQIDIKVRGHTRAA